VEGRPGAGVSWPGVAALAGGVLLASLLWWWLG